MRPSFRDVPSLTMRICSCFAGCLMLARSARISLAPTTGYRTSCSASANLSPGRVVRRAAERNDAASAFLARRTMLWRTAMLAAKAYRCALSNFVPCYS